MRLLRKNGPLVRVAVVVALNAGLCGAAAQTSGRAVGGFHHTAWTSESGLGAVFDIQEESSGYLWLTTSKGVFRFDGVRLESIEEVTNGALRNGEIDLASVSSHGGVWFTTRRAGLLLWKNGQITNFPDRRCTPALKIGGLAEDQNGSIWVQQSATLFRLRGSVCEQIGAEHGYPGGFAAGILVDSEGTLWVKTAAGDLLFLPRGQSRFQRSPYGAGPTTQQAFLREAPDGSIWLSDDWGLRRVTDRPGAPAFPLRSGKASKRHLESGDFSFASDGSLWKVSVRGVERFDHVERWRNLEDEEAALGESLTPKEGLSSDAAWRVVISREGCVWVGTNSGLDRFRRTAITMVMLPHTQEHEFGIAAGDEGSVWTGSKSLPLTHVINGGEVKSFPQTGQVMCIRRDRNGTIWSAGQGQFRLWRSVGNKVVPMHYPGEDFASVVSLAVDRNDELWISRLGPEIFHLTHKGTWEPQSAILGRKPGVLGAMVGDDAGNVWFSFSNKLVQWDGSKYLRFSFPDGPLNISVTTMAVRKDHVWLAGTGGVVLFSQGQFHLLHWKDKDLPGRISGIAETKSGDLWINGFSGVTHVSAVELAKWLHDPTAEVSAEPFNGLDGLPGLSSERYPEPSVVESSDGRLWFATTKGIAWLDPKKLDRNRNRIPPTVVISSIISNGKSYPGAANGLTLPAHTQNLQIDYTALSLAVPERVMFRYKLDGVDKDWRDVGTRRQAFYNSLRPGRYRFRVIACNNDGVWNDSGVSLQFAIAPAFYQTPWFITLCGLAVIMFLWWLVHLRILSITRQLQARLAERLAERERIARELHDTILQGFYAVVLRLQTAADQVPEREPARRIIEDALDRVEGILEQGRDRVRDLRGESDATCELSDELARVAAEFKIESTASFHVEIEGISRSLHPVVYDEVFRIGSEAIANAFKHSAASLIEIELTYDISWLLLQVRDDGKGIASEILDAGGRVDHWGMIGMRERAQKIGAQFSIWSREGAGTEIQLKVPCKIAYQSAPGKLWRQRFSKLRN